MKNSRINKWVLLAIVLGFMACGILAALPARAELPITANGVDDGSSDMMIDPYGTLHVVYERGGIIYYTLKATGAWSNAETVASGYSPAIALDSDQVPHVAFISSGVKYTNRLGGGWMETPATVAGSESVNYVDMDIDGNGKAHIVYSDPWYDGDSYNEILYTNNVSSSFSAPSLLRDSWFDGDIKIGNYFYYPNIKVDGSGNYHISFCFGYVSTWPGEDDYTYIKYTNNLGADLTAPTVFGWGGAPTAMVSKNGIALDGDGDVHLAYYSGSSLYYGRISGGGWNENTGWATGSQPSLNVDASKNAYIIYVNDSGGISYVMRHNMMGFSGPSTISSTPSGRNPMITAESWPRALFEAHDGTDYELYYAVVGPAIDVSPGSFYFGSFNVGSSSDPKTITISSIGTMDLSVSGFTLSDTDNYTLDSSGCGEDLPFTLTPGSSCTVEVTFHPTTSDVLFAELTVSSNDVSGSTGTAYLAGTGSNFTLAVSKEGTGSGSVTSSPTGIDCGDDCSEGYDPDTTVTLTATADEGSHFDSWDGCDSAVGNECTLTMDANKEVTATFTSNTYTLTVERAGTGSGSVTSSPEGIDCGSDCSEAYDYGTSVTLTATESLGSTFTRWDGCDSVEGGQCTVTISNDRTVTAEFTLDTYTLSVEKEGSGSGTVTSSPAGVDCGDDCSEVYGYGTTIVLAATPNGVSSFDSWEGCDSVNGDECTVTLGGDANVTATFSHVPGDVFVCPTGCDHDSIQSAIDASGPGDTIKVAKGTYYENVSIYDSKEFTLQGGWNSTFTTRTNNPALTVIDGEVKDLGAGTGSVLAFDAGSGMAIQATIENLTLRNGSQSQGGGIYAVAYDSGTLNLTLLKNVIRDNQATDGGGIFVSSASSGEIQLTVINNLIFNNSASYGAGIFAVAGDSSSLTASLIFNTITDNDADTGGGLYALSEGGTLSVWVNNSILWGNSALTSGDDIFMVGVNTTVNTRFSDIGVWVNEGDSATYTEDTNINDDPIFVNPTLGNYHLNSDSPCRDAGTPVKLGEPALVGLPLPRDDFEGEARPQGSGYDIGADEFAMVFKKVKVLAFNGGEFLPTGETWNITWGAPDSAMTFNLSYTIDDGLTWKSIAKGVTGNHYAWPVPAQRNNKKAKVKVVGFNSKSVQVGSDASDAAFTIGVVRVLSPNGGEELFSGNAWPVYWETNETVAEVNTVELYYTTNGGTTWKFIDNPTEEGYYKWYPEVLADKTKCKVKVVLKDAAGRIIGSDVSDKVFTIRPGR